MSCGDQITVFGYPSFVSKGGFEKLAYCKKYLKKLRAFLSTLSVEQLWRILVRKGENHGIVLN